MAGAAATVPALRDEALGIPSMAETTTTGALTLMRLHNRYLRAQTGCPRRAGGG